jgi:hypothetical protein
MTAKDENDSADQNFMSVQEQIDQESNYMQLDTDDKYDAQSKKIKNLAAGVLDHEAVRVDQMLPYQTAAAASASAAAASAAAAASDAADTAADLVLTDADQQTVAADKAIVAADKATVNTDKGIVAADKATVAADKATVAADKATTLGYKNDAETAKTAAETAETNAETAETLAEDWASKAEDSIVADGKYSSYHWAQKADEWTNDALHDNQANEFSAVAEKTSPVDNDIFLIEDSEAGYVKKKLKMTNILAGSTAAGTAFDDANFDKFLDGADETTEYLQDVLDLIDEQAVEVVEQAAEPTTTYPGLIWIDTDDQVNPNSDADAIHDNTSGEIAAVTEKTTPVSADLLLIEDSAASNAKKRVQIGNLPAADADAIHDNTSGEISAVTEKTTPVAADLILIEDSAAGNAKKKVQVGNLPYPTNEWVHIETKTASSDATLVFQNLGDYDELMITIGQLEPATDNADLNIQFSDDNGSTWEAGTQYNWYVWTAAGGSAAEHVLDDSEWSLNHRSYGIGNGTNEGFTGTFHILNWKNASYPTSAVGNHHYHDSGTWYYCGYNGCHFDTSSALNALRIYWDSGNIDRGVVSVYGIKRG